MNGREDARDAIGAFALGVLPAREAGTLRELVRRDASLRTEYDELREAADAVGASAEATLLELDELAASRLKRRVMLAVREPLDERGVPVPRVARPLPNAWLGYGVAAAAIIVAVSSYASSASLQLQVAADRTALAQARGDATAAADRDRDRIAFAQEERRSVEAVLSEHARHYRLPHGDVVSTQGRLYLALTKLRALPAGRVYQAWTLVPGHDPVPNATFVPQGDVTLVALGAPGAGVDAVALTIEPKGGSKRPTSAPTFVRRLD